MKNVQQDQYGLRAHVKVGSNQKVKRFKFGEWDQAKRWLDETRVALRKKPKVSRDTLRADAIRYLEHMKTRLAKATYASRVCEINAWLPALGHVRRSDITRDHILNVRHGWLEDNYAPKTCNHRTRALKHLYRYLDGSGETPLDDVPKLAEPDAEPKFVDVRTVKRVAARITNTKTRGRFMVLVSTGQRPAQLKRAQPPDVDLRRGLWLVRPAKKGNPIPVILTDDMRAAFRVFMVAGAWGHFDSSDYAKELYAAGWPKSIRPYNAKHTVAITLANAGVEWEDIKDWFGHTDVKTTRIYTGQVLNRLRKTSQKLSGRIGW